MKPIVFGALILLAGTVAPAQAQYPSRPLRLVVPFGAGSANDILGRLIGPPLSSALGRPVVIDNRPGVGGNIGAELAAAAPPDGYTLMMGNISHAIAMTLYAKPGYDLAKNFAPVTLLAYSTYLVVVHPSLPVKSVKELIALAKARPGQLNLGTAGSGVYLASQLFNRMTGIKTTTVMYRSTPQAVTALLSGEASVGFPPISSVLPHVQSGKLRALAVTSVHRSAIAPDLPSVAEAGVPGYEAIPWYGLLVPAGTPNDVISRLNAEAVKVVRQPDIKERFVASNFEPVGGTPADFATLITGEIAKWGKVVKATGMRPE